MKLTKIGLALLGATLLAVPSQALILTIDNIPIGTGPIGMIEPGNPSNPEDEATYVNTLLGYNDLLTHVVSSPPPLGEHSYTRFDLSHYGETVTGGIQVGDLQDSDENVTGLLGSYFILAKYGGRGNPDLDNGGGSFLWFVAGGDVTLPLTSDPFFLNNGGNGKGLSHYTTFASTNVPDGGSTVALFGLALIGLTSVRRMFLPK